MTEGRVSTNCKENSVLGPKKTEFPRPKKSQIISHAHLVLIHKRLKLLVKYVSHLPYPVKEGISQHHVVPGVWRRVTNHLSQHYMNTHQCLQLPNVGDVLQLDSDI